MNRGGAEAAEEYLSFCPKPRVILSEGPVILSEREESSHGYAPLTGQVHSTPERPWRFSAPPRPGDRRINGGVP
jgi:hypothetical protein